MKNNSEQKDEITSVAPDGSNANVGCYTVKLLEWVRRKCFRNALMLNIEAWTNDGRTFYTDEQLLALYKNELNDSPSVTGGD
jgi:hypothetical protein